MKHLKITPKITNQNNEISIHHYLIEVSKEEMITYHEEIELAKRIKQGDHKALDKLVRANLRFVISVAKQYQNMGIPLADLITEGNIGLIKAAQRFDETKGFKFISYAVWWIRQSILQAIAEQSRIVRLPSNRIATITKVNKLISKLEQDEERNLDPYQIAEEADISVEEVQEAMIFNNGHIRLDTPLNASDTTTTLLDLLPTNDSSPPDHTLEYESFKQDLQRILKTLPEREVEILNASYGLNGFYPLSLDEMAHKYQISKERIRQIRDKAIKKLKHLSKNKILKSYIN